MRGIGGQFRLDLLSAPEARTANNDTTPVSIAPTRTCRQCANTQITVAKWQLNIGSPAQRNAIELGRLTIWIGGEQHRMETRRKSHPISGHPISVIRYPVIRYPVIRNTVIRNTVIRGTAIRGTAIRDPAIRRLARSLIVVD